MTQTSPLIKICGITRQADADACVAAGVDMIGFIFHEDSPRNVQPGQAEALSTGGALRVGVFVRQTQAEVLDIMHRARLDLAQLAGDQDWSFCRAVGAERVMRVFWPQRHRVRVALEDELRRFEGFAGFALLDAGLSGGGHGRAQDFGFLKGLSCPMPWLLAGGLSPETLPQAMDQCSPVGFDLNSGLESSPGVKDPQRIARAVEMIRARP
ncbi:phosphoribosylanthranilate isomerase [Desulfocurvus sp. DL9XJH121]